MMVVAAAMETAIPPRQRRTRRHSLGLRQHHVQFHDIGLEVTVTKRAVEVDQWINKIVYENQHRLPNVVVGLDIEWHPCKPSEENPAATLQLCVGKSCLIFQLLHRDCIPYSLFAFLADPFFVFVGVGVQDDAGKLFRDHGLVVRRVADLRILAARIIGEEWFLRTGLKKIALRVIGREMEKPIKVTLSDWDARNLSFEQIEYASIDAFASSESGRLLLARANCMH